MSDVWTAVKDKNLGKALLAVRIFRQGKEVRTVRLENTATYIGRMPENHVVLDDPKASRSHARILLKHGEFIVEDQQSENGMFVNGTKVDRQVIGVGDKITIGDHVLEVVRAVDDDASAIRESQIENAVEEEWRMDQTVSVSSAEIQKQHLEAMAKKKGSSQAPEFSFKLSFGGKTFEKQFKFEKGQRRPAGPNSVEIRVSLGEFVVEKKVDL